MIAILIVVRSKSPFSSESLTLSFLVALSIGSAQLEYWFINSRSSSCALAMSSGAIYCMEERGRSEVVLSMGGSCRVSLSGERVLSLSRGRDDVLEGLLCEPEVRGGGRRLPESTHWAVGLLVGG